MIDTISNINNKELQNLCIKYDLKKMYLIGSYSKNQENSNSDIDFLISFKDSLSIDEYTENYFNFYISLEKLFNKDIDLITERSLKNPYFIEDINKNKVLLFESKD